MDLAIQADPENDIVYFALSRRAFRKGTVRRTVRVDEDVALDFDGSGRLLGMEIMNASSRLEGALGDIRLDALVGVKEAARIAGVRPSNFVRDYADRPDFPRPVVALANGRVWLKTQVEQYAHRRKQQMGMRAS